MTTLAVFAPRWKSEEWLGHHLPDALKRSCMATRTLTGKVAFVFGGDITPATLSKLSSLVDAGTIDGYRFEGVLQGRQGWYTEGKRRTWFPHAY